VIEAVLIGGSLALDAFAVSVSSGVSIQGLEKRHEIRASFCFGCFQFLMPVAGWLLGKTFVSYIEAFDHWIAFGLLAFLGGKMLFQELVPKKRDAREAAASAGDIRRLPVLLLLAVATSIDALAVGISFSITGAHIWRSAAIIGVVTFAVCLLGFEFGRRAGTMFQKHAQIAGGLILTGIGIKILMEHLA
jgi:putative Mn2+ efflux pump MntP